MTKKQQIFKCEICGNIVEVLHAGVGQLVCCNRPMTIIKENTEDAALEKHVPIIERTGDGILVKVGSVAHPMEDGHYIEWIQLIADGKAYREFLSSNQEPQAFFKIDADTVTAYAYCNLHGLWISS